MAFKLFDYVNDKNINEIKEWTTKLQTAERAKLNEKLDKLSMHGDELMPELLTDSGITGIKKLRIKVHNVQLRPLLCNGPINHRTEYTLLMGAKEIGSKWSPRNAPDIASQKKQEIIKEPDKRRIEHERISKTIS